MKEKIHEEVKAELLVHKISKGMTQSSAIIDLAISKTAKAIFEDLKRDGLIEEVDDMVYMEATVEDWDNEKKKWCE